MRASSLMLVLLLAEVPAGFASETLLYENFEDADAREWKLQGDDAIGLSDYLGNASLRLRRGASAFRGVDAGGATRVRFGAAFAAADLAGGESCLGEASVDGGKSWFTVVRVAAGLDDAVTLHANAISHDVPPGTDILSFRARLRGGESTGTCWLDNVYMLGEAGPSLRNDTAGRTLDATLLSGDGSLAGPVPMQEYAMPADAAAPGYEFSGTLRLVDTASSTGFEAIHDPWNRVAEVGPAIRHLPGFEFRFVQRGSDIVPLRRGVIRTKHPYWEFILQPGRAWNDDSAGDRTRISLPFSLQERSANCTHNGVMTWLFDGDTVSRVAYQIGSETCGYFKANLWGILSAEYVPERLEPEAEAQFRRLDAHRAARLPVRTLAQLARDYPGVEPLSLGVDDGIDPRDITVLGMVVDGVHYRSECGTRHGPYPYCASQPLPSYSTAKSIFAGIAAMRLEKLHPGARRQSIASLIDQCDPRRWQDVTIENALDMATGNFRSPVHEEDEFSVPHEWFVFADNRRDKLSFACNFFPRKAEPGTRFVYHTSDSYVLGTALAGIVARHDAEADLYDTVIAQPIWGGLELSPLLDGTKRTYDHWRQPFTGYGLTYEADDIVRIAAWLNHGGGRLNGEAMLDDAMLNAALQRIPGDTGPATEVPNLRYNNGFWAFDAGPSIGCEESVWVPYMSGVGGIAVVMFPNGVTYYYFSDSYVYRWQSARNAAHAIRSLCK